jgi:maltokinase
VAQSAGKPAITSSRTARLLTIDQSNTSVVLGERLVIKCYRLLVEGIHPEPEILAALAGFPHVPAYGGSLVHRSGSGAETALACLQGFVVGDGGWEQVVASLVGCQDADGEERAASARDAAEYGEVTAALHVALARSFGVGSATRGEAAERAAAAREQLDAAAEAVPAEARGVVDAVRPALSSRLDALAAAEGTPISRAHGDLHVGQFLRSRDGLVVVDFEGEPGRSLAERRTPWTPLRDVACLLLSLDHAAIAAARRVQAAGADPSYLAAWADEARSAALGAYARGVAGSRLVVDERLLRGCEAEKECAELLYAAGTLPEWLYAPLEVLRRRFAGDG